MANAVSNASIVCCFMTPKYEDSKNCKLELEHAQTLGKRIIPCMVTNRKLWKPSPAKWLSLITSATIAVDFSDFSEANATTKARELISRIRNESLTPVTQSTKCFESIRQKYLQENRLKRLVNVTKSFPIDQSYINLSMIETKEQQEKEKKLKQHDEQESASKQHNDKILGTYEEIYGTKTTIDVKNIFDNCKDQTKKVLLLGRAGIGKSTFCQYVTYKWAKGELWTQYDLVILIRLRKLTESRYLSGQNYSPFDLVEKEYFPFDKFSNEEKQQFQEHCNNGKVLWILDGYDEFVHNIPDKVADAFNYILTRQHHILTSRPYVIALPYYAKMEITGFTNDNIEKYIEQFFDQIKNDIPNGSFAGKKLLHFLKSNTSIWGIAHIPVNLELICSLWGDTDWSKKKTLTMTTLYDNITEWLCKRHLTKQNNDSTQMRKKKLYDLCKKELHFLEVLAFNAMEHSDVILPPTLLEKTEHETECDLDEHPQLLNFGILRSYNDMPTGSQHPAEQQYYFIHLSFQEYFAARHLIRTLNSPEKQKAINFINKHKYNRRYLYVFIFASGLLVQSDNKSSMEVFWSTIQGEPLDLAGLTHIKLIIECLDELTGQTLFRQSADLMKSILDWLDVCISTKSTAIIENLLQSLMRTSSICNSSILQNKILELLHIEDQAAQYIIYHIISNLPIHEPMPELISKLCTAVQDGDADVRYIAWKALGALGEKAATNGVISAFVNAFWDEDLQVKTSACEAILMMGEKAATNEVISALINALRDEEWHVRQSACEVLEVMGEKAATNEMISALINALRDEDSHIRKSACKALEAIGEKAATNEVISSLINALWDEDSDVRQSACAALKAMGEKAATNEVISGLINARRDDDLGLQLSTFIALEAMGEKAATNEVISVMINDLRNKDLTVRQCACLMLKAMGKKAATNEVISALINALRDKISSIRKLACKVLRTMGEKAATNEVISALINALQDADLDVRRNALTALKAMGEIAPTNGVISSLIDALLDEDSDVRGWACAALKVIGEKAATSEVIFALINALWDEDSDVRGSACAALGAMGEKAATNEVISSLINALRDNDLDVRQYACEALERAMCCYPAMKELVPQTLQKLYKSIRKLDKIKLNILPSNQLIKLYLETKNDAWLPMVTYTALLQGVAVTIVEDKIMIYHMNEVSELNVSSQELKENLVNSFKNQQNEFRQNFIALRKTGIKMLE
ncbi:unnamed protein product [Adineta steineri]|uniref:NACHT domain-containing protein n=1 Tax=Adineta steineri TaxID=433720 RepID=A0A815TMK5_9BILA|nr:unnamed protein product [Adineta steineri]CAF3762879.1 unnamed protein product [Adineta steineri]